ncbi:MAG TPA: efflux RND transporter periplasmic adaptor subunit [Pseudomonas xinjiangensis]|uniref:Efflux RND transporter periplasmic adaptor subunit n=2 Tax=root TaxID=1 RepID=A0A7V1BQ78_9GAMM|nr:efflux RND transporter periplasmic adaptor subunit [Halopseudomonas xinjiangensis]HEC48845.1 efflux RND transporter periplasmic adaptor subunit [Halopseudomonas xinjiangensis]
MFISSHSPSLYFKAALFAAVCLLLSGCGQDGNAVAAGQTARAAVPVRAAEVSRSAETEPLRFAGVVRSRQRASLTFQVGGVLSSRAAELGQIVEAGQALAKIYNPELGPARDAAQARVKELQSQTGQARRDLERAEQLYDKGVVSASEREQQRSRLEGLVAAVGNAQAAARRTEQLQNESQLRAPFSGSIEAVLVEPGEFVAPGQTVMRLAAANGLEVEVKVPASMLADLETGQRLPAWNTLSGAELEGRVVEVGLGSSEGGALYPLVISIPSAAARTGDAVEVGLQRLNHEGLTVPLASIMRSADGLAVFRITDNKAQRVPVVVSSLQGERAMLGASQLQAGDQVVYAGLTRLAENDQVELLP